MKQLMIVVAVMWVGLSSCRSYIGKNCFERAEYDAFSLSTDISSADGRKVLSDGERYYIQLPRYRRASRTFNWAEMMGDKFRKSEQTVRVPGVEDIYTLHPELALYVTGQSTKPPSDITKQCTPAERATDFLPHCTKSLPIVNTPEKGSEGMTLGYRRIISPNAGFHRAMGYTSNLLLDVPLTVVQNATLVAAGAVGFAGSAIIAPVFIPLLQVQQSPAEKPQPTEN